MKKKSVEQRQLDVAIKALHAQDLWLPIIFDAVKDIGKFLGNTVKLAHNDLKKHIDEIERIGKGKK